MHEVKQVAGDLDVDFYTDALAADAIAWDIETSGLDWSKDRVATCQLALPDGRVRVVRVDMDRRPGRLVSVLEEATTRKVFHHAPFDLRFMMAAWGAAPRSIACTKIASKILEPTLDSSQHSLKPLLERHLGIEISKDEQVSDWLAPELSTDQVSYAAADVAHLLALEKHLVSRSKDAGLVDLLMASWRYLPARASLDILGAGDVFTY